MNISNVYVDFFHLVLIILGIGIMIYVLANILELNENNSEEE